jgi:hypothetical protein
MFKTSFFMKLRPLHDRVIVKRVENETKPPLASSFLTALLKSQIRARSWLLARAKE